MEEEVFTCAGCGVNFADSESANDHANGGSHDAKYEYNCRLCGRTSASSLEMAEHYSTDHSAHLTMVEKDKMRTVR